jgi:hypothetical protein
MKTTILLVRIPEGKRQLGKPRCRWEDKFRIDLQEVPFEDGDWSYLACNRDEFWALKSNEHLSSTEEENIFTS